MMQRFAVMGNPIAHSLSPFIHQRFAEQTGQAISYEKIFVTAQDFPQQVANFFAEGGKGLNITSPLKEQAFSLAKVTTARCQQAKAANTLWLENGLLHADNTDGIGLIRDLNRFINLSGKQVLLIGAGGAARGVIGSILAAGAYVTVANRSYPRALLLQQDFPSIKLENFLNIQGKYEIVIQATSAAINQEEVHWNPSILQSNAFCYDLSYALEKTTPFVQWSLDQGCQAKDGLGMLVEQAAEAFFIWHRIAPNSDLVLAELC